MLMLKQIKDTSFDPESVERLGNVYERVWTAVGDNYLAHEIDHARARLAKLILALDAEVVDPASIEATAVLLIRKTLSEHGKTPAAAGRDLLRIHRPN